METNQAGALDPLRLTFIATIHSTESSEIFHVKYYDEMDLCLKVFHIDEDPGFAHDGRDLSRYRCESQAYQRLQAHGVCSQGRVPKFYGTIEDLDPGLFGSQLAAFENDKQKPSAILLEYLPEAEPLTKNNIREGFVQLGLDGLEKIHAAGVIHNDPYPDNVVVSEDRLVWIDFDTAIVFPEGRKKRGKLRLKVEVEEESACFESAANNIDRYS